MTDDVLEPYKEMLGTDNFNVKIEDGNMIITPAESGILLLTNINTSEEIIADFEEKLLRYDKELTLVLDENELLRELLLMCQAECTIPNELNKAIEETLWRVVGVYADGTEVEIEMRDNE